ncbi:anti-sigma factor family protein [Salisaeta longa]|uniref:anti-sigma factor family protein n=1 Tax=Salisaeta longa TaxID=503170 RepID=UPI0003B5DB8C|nr:hypothetical protein [Salisaeta longa]
MTQPDDFASFGASDDDDASYEWLDEWLCEYVDGTMPPAQRRIFEQYVDADPQLKAHIEDLKATRQLLQRCRCTKAASQRAQARICRTVECELLRSGQSSHEFLSAHPAWTAGVASSVALALVLGVFVGLIGLPDHPRAARPEATLVAPVAPTAPAWTPAPRNAASGLQPLRTARRPMPRRTPAVHTVRSYDSTRTLLLTPARP